MNGGDSGAPKPAIDRRREIAIGVALCLVIGGFLLWATRGQTFYADEWSFYVRAGGFDGDLLFAPHLGNLVVAVVLVYKVVLGIFGAGDHLPLRLVWIGLDLAAAIVLYALLRSRVGAFAALVPAVLLSVFGIAWEFFAGSLGITGMLAVSTGLGSLLAVERGTTRADVLACLLLLVSLASLSTGIAFAAGVLASLLISSRPWRRIWVAAIPLVLYAAWSLWARKYGESGITVETLASAPSSMVAALAAGSAALFGAFAQTGLNATGNTTKFVIFVNEGTGTLIGAVLVVGAIWRIADQGFQRRYVPPLVMLLVYWGSLALVSPARVPNTSRYQYAAAVFILLLFAELWRGWRPSRGGAAVLAAVGIVSLVPNAINLAYAADFIRTTSQQDRAELAIADALSTQVAPETIISPPGAGIGNDLVVGYHSYRVAAEVLGTPAYAVDEIDRAGEEAQYAADKELVYLHGVGVLPGALGSGRGCRLIEPGAGGFEVPRGGFSFVVTDGGEGTVGVRRFSNQFQKLEPVSGGPYQVPIGADQISRPWFATVESAGPVEVCPLPAGG